MAEPKTVSESGATTVAMYQASDEILLKNLDSSDYPILADISASTGGKGNLIAQIQPNALSLFSRVGKTI